MPSSDRDGGVADGLRLQLRAALGGAFEGGLSAYDARRLFDESMNDVLSESTTLNGNVLPECESGESGG
jgi:hypothetical protein